MPFFNLSDGSNPKNNLSKICKFIVLIILKYYKNFYALGVKLQLWKYAPKSNRVQIEEQKDWLERGTKLMLSDAIQENETRKNEIHRTFKKQKIDTKVRCIKFHKSSFQIPFKNWE